MVPLDSRGGRSGRAVRAREPAGSPGAAGSVGRTGQALAVLVALGWAVRTAPGWVVCAVRRVGERWGQDVQDARNVS